MLFEYFLKRKGFWNNRFLSKLVFFNFFLKPLVFLDVKFLEKSQYWQQGRIAEMQFARIKHILKTAYVNVALYRDLYKDLDIDIGNIRNFDDFEHIPVLKKEYLRRQPPQMAINRLARHHWLYYDSTSGSTGIPLNFVVDRGFIMRSLAFSQRILRILGAENDCHFIRFSMVDRPGFYFGNYLFPVSEYNFDYRVKELCRLYSGKDLVIYSVSSYLFDLARSLPDDVKLPNFKAAIASGEVLSNAQKEFIKQKFGCPVIRCYVSRELGWIAQECLAGNFHINSEWCYVEIINNEGKKLPVGQQGRIIVTLFDNEAMPFIRYDTGDLGKILKKRCRCGRTLPVLEFDGRASGLIYLPGGKTLHYFRLLPIFHSRADRVERFQIIQEALHRIVVKLIPSKNFASDDAFKIAEEIESVLGESVEVSVNLASDIPAGSRGKSLAFISRVRN